MTTREVTYLDLPDLPETFADSVRFIGFDGQTWRIELMVTRIQPEQIKPGAAGVPATQTPSCRLVLTVAAGLDLLNKLTQTADALEKQGILKRNQPAPPPFVMPESKNPH